VTSEDTHQDDDVDRFMEALAEGDRAQSDMLTKAEIEEAVAEAVRLGQEVAEEEHRSFMGRMATAFRRGAERHADVEVAASLGRLAELAEVEAQRPPAYLRKARYLGADAAAAAASALTMSEADARALINDNIPPEVLDRYPEPNLSGEWADDPTPASIVAEATGFGIEALSDDHRLEVMDAVAAAWESGVEQVWSLALCARALRVLGRIDRALDVEREFVEQPIERLRADL
jgi:hypothetical protein